MAASQKITMDAATGLIPTATPAVASDIFGTLLSTNEALTGMYGLAQKAGLFVAGMATQSKRSGGSLNPFSS